MERFVRLVVVGGIALVVGLWIAAFAAAWSGPWLVGAALAAAGAVALSVGTVSELRY